MTDPKPVRAAGEQTFDGQFERWWLTTGLQSPYNQKGTAREAWHARDQAVKHLEERIGELECQVGIEQKGAVSLLERIERVRALKVKYEQLGDRAWKLTGVKKTYQDIATEIQAALSEE